MIANILVCLIVFAFLVFIHILHQQTVYHPAVIVQYIRIYATIDSARRTPLSTH